MPLWVSFVVHGGCCGPEAPDPSPGQEGSDRTPWGPRARDPQAARILGNGPAAGTVAQGPRGSQPRLPHARPSSPPGLTRVIASDNY